VELTTKISSAPITEDYRSVRSAESKAVFKIQHHVMSAIRSFLEKQEFVEVAPVIISPATDPGIRGAETASIDFYGRKYLLTTSMILHKQMLMSALDRIFVFSPCVRLEKRQTNRHLSSFVQVDVEVARASREEIIQVAEELIVTALDKIAASASTELDVLDRQLRVPHRPFKRITLREAIGMARKLGCKTPDDSELSYEAETALSKYCEEPLWIVDYPPRSRGFYYRTHPSDPDKLRDFDLLFPEGFGEGISGGEREYRYEAVVEKMKQRQLSPQDYDWYLEMLQSGIPPSGGFGIGLERFTRYICGLDAISEATPFPRIPVAD
jgi:asparaginyl-tRNA synthetase